MAPSCVTEWKTVNSLYLQLLLPIIVAMAMGLRYLAGVLHLRWYQAWHQEGGAEERDLGSAPGDDSELGGSSTHSHLNASFSSTSMIDPLSLAGGSARQGKEAGGANHEDPHAKAHPGFPFSIACKTDRQLKVSFLLHCLQDGPPAEGEPPPCPVGGRGPAAVQFPSPFL